jgi:hypothetical protein
MTTTIGGDDPSVNSNVAYQLLAPHAGRLLALAFSPGC